MFKTSNNKSQVESRIRANVNQFSHIACIKLECKATYTEQCTCTTDNIYKLFRKIYNSSSLCGAAQAHPDNISNTGAIICYDVNTIPLQEFFVIADVHISLLMYSIH